jgi:hypothetical protein
MNDTIILFIKGTPAGRFAHPVQGQVIPLPELQTYVFNLEKAYALIAINDKRFSRIRNKLL